MPAVTVPRGAGRAAVWGLAALLAAANVAVWDSGTPLHADPASVEGMNHSQFGAYTGQRGGRPASVPYRETHGRLAGIVVPWFENGSRTS